ncbi:MAG: BglG family transcription antiterminator [Clostridia bacterium]|nr:BglG family transcription antiterminator [Clostridia bacterium]
MEESTEAILVSNSVFVEEVVLLDTKINLRVKNILQKIFSENDYTTVTAIAKELGISNRTILRELPAVEKWLAKRGCKLEKKAGVGIRAIGSTDDRNKIISLLEEEKEEKIYTPKERQTIICSELLQNQEPVKLYTFTKTLNVTEGTISNDLDKLEEWLANQGLTLVRKPGLGIYIEGEEDSIRKCMINLIYENLNENYLLGLIRKNISKEQVPVSKTELIARSRLLNLVNNNTIHELENLVHRAEEQIGYNLADSAVVGLIVHLAIAIQRIKKNEDIVMDKQFMEDLKKSEEYAVAERLALEIEDIFGIKIPLDEIGYITMHIKGSKSREVAGKSSEKAIGNSELVELSKEIIRIAENETGKFLSQNEKLLTGLVNHLGPAISRLRMNLEIRNPLYKEIKAHYPDLLKLAGKCVSEVEKFIGMKIPETEVAYIAMHLGAAIEKSQVPPKRSYRAAIACATGIGTSRLLATRIEKEYNNIEVVDVTSMLHLEQDWLRSKGIEFIISTVGIGEAPVPVVIVNPLLFEEDKQKIQKLIKQLESAPPSSTSVRKKSLNLKDKMADLNNYSKAITEILDYFFVNEATHAEDVNGLIDELSRQIAQNEEAEEQLKVDLKAREAKGGTFISEFGILLLHCRTKAVDKLHFGAVKMNGSLRCLNSEMQMERAELGIVILAPEDSSKYLLETISYVNGMLVDNPDFIQLLKNGTEEEAFDELSAILEEFYKVKHNKYLSDSIYR